MLTFCNLISWQIIEELNAEQSDTYFSYTVVVELS